VNGRSGIYADISRQLIEKSPGTIIYTFSADGNHTELTVGELVADAGRIAASLRALVPRGARCLLVYPPGLGYVRALFGCLFAGVVAVPAQAPDPRLAERQARRMAAIAADCQASAVLTTTELAAFGRAGALGDALTHLPWVVTDAAAGPAAGPEPMAPEPADPESAALLQYTSGSTRSPRGVLVTQANLAHNAANIAGALDLTPSSTVALWLPPHHDMGLIGGILQSAFTGHRTVLMSPVEFLRRPAAWLEAITRHRATHAGGPNFGYDLCARKVTGPERASLDLSSWRVAFSGAEPVRAGTMDRFAAAFADRGFDARAFCPVYGLAEATLLVSAARPGSGPTVGRFDAHALVQHRAVAADEPGAEDGTTAAADGGGRSRRIVSCGRPVTDLAIVDPDTATRRPEGRVGEIWLRGPVAAAGYLGNAEATARVFRARLEGDGDSFDDGGTGPFLRTGDLGFLRGGELYVTGRADDMMIVRGRNHYPQDVELTVETSHPAMRPGCGVAFTAAVDGGEHLVVVQEIAAGREGEADEAMRAARAAVAREHGLHVYAIALVRPRAVPKTASGKVQRSAARELFLSGRLDAVARSVRRPSELSELRGALADGPVAPGAVEAMLVDLLARRAGVPPGEVDPGEPISQLGIDSVVSVEIAEEARAWLGVDLEPAALYDEVSLAELAGLLARRGRAEPAAAPADTASATAAFPAVAATAAAFPAPTAAPAPTPTPTPTLANDPSGGDAIAVVGLGCRFPGAPDPDAYWRLLRDGGDAIGDIPPDRWDVEAYFHPEPGTPGRMYTRRGGFLDRVDGFDAAFFGISPREAAEMDPQQRLLLEVTWEALEDAGIVPAELAGSRTGVFVGLSNEEYSQLRPPGDVASIGAYTGTGIAASVAAGRLSYVLGLAGPSLIVDTACSSSLVSVHLACASLRSGETDLALAGGVNLMLSPRGTVYFCQVGVMSPAGACRTFDAGADGYVRAEGCGVIVLKRLADARRDGDPVVAVIRGSAVNHDGRGGGLTVPSGRAQQAVIRQALAAAGVAAGEVGFVEAHGTATAIGDPIEARALAEVFARAGGRPLALGSVKTNIGHGEAAAGIAGIIKVALALRHGRIPPNLHYDTPNPHVPLARMNAFVPTSLAEWPPGARIAGVSSFGLSGTNAHVVLAAAPVTASRDEGPAATAGPRVLPLSARGPEALRALAARHLELAAEAGDNPAALAVLGARAAAAARRRQHHDDRLAVTFTGAEQLRDCLEAYLRDESRPGLSSGRRAEGRDARVVFVFGGQGSQWPGMARALLAGDAVFRAAIERVGAAIEAEAGWSLTRVLTDADPAALDRIDVVQPALFAIQVALAELWRARGVEPSAVVGQSMGEVAAAHVAGALGLADASRVICRRSRLMRRVSGTGAMAVVDLSHDAAAAALAAWPDRLSVAVASSPRSSVVSGDAEAIDAFVALMERREVFCRRVNVDVASHSPQVEPLRADLIRELAGIAPTRPAVPMYSTLLGRRVDEAVFDAGYWWRNLREPVLLAGAVERLIGDGRSLFCELGPHPVVLPAIEQTIRHGGRPGAVVASLRRDEEDEFALGAALGALYCAGAAVDWAAVHPRAEPVALPAYPWQRERFWPDGAGAEAAGAGATGDGAGTGTAGARPGRAAGPAAPDGDGRLLGRHVRLAGPPGAHVWTGTLGVASQPYLADHRVDGAIVLPAAAYIEMALTAGAAALGEGPLELTDVEFERALVLPPDGSRDVQLVLTPRLTGTAAFEVFSRDADAGGDAGAGDGDGHGWVAHARGRVRRLPDAAPAPELVRPGPAPRDDLPGDDLPDDDLPDDDLPDDDLPDDDLEVLTGEGHYEALAARSMAYGPSFRALTEIWRGTQGARGRVQPPPAVARTAAEYRLHPVLLDAGFQLLAAAARGLAADPADGAYLPVGLRRLRVRRWGATVGWARARHALAPDGDSAEGDSAEGEGVEGSVALFDDDGALVAEASGLRARRVETGGSRRADPSDDLYELAWRRLPGEIPSPRTGRTGTWILLADAAGVAEAVRATLTSQGNRCVLVRPARATGGPTGGPAGGPTGGEPDRDREADPDTDTLDPASPDDCQRLIARVCADGPPAGIVHLWAADVPAVPASPEALDAARDLLVGGALHLVQATSRAGWRNPPRLWFVTAGAQVAGAGPAAAARSGVAVTHAPLWGLGRVVGQELPELRASCVDLSPPPAAGGADPAELAALAGLLLAEGTENQLALRGADRFAARLVRATVAEPDAGAPRALTTAGLLAGAQPDEDGTDRDGDDGDRGGAGQAFRLVAEAPGILDELALRALDRRAPDPGEIEIEVHAAGLNFSDVLKAMGIYPGLAGAEPVLGGECAGVVVRLGAGTRGFAVGDRVAAIAPWSLASHVTVAAGLAFGLPDGLTFAAAATVPVAFATACYALEGLAGLRAGERVLIHSASGGVGLAAIQLARTIGAEVVATAGSEEKREFLRGLGIATVLDSRSPAFAEEILAERSLADGGGVDVVLNSLSGAALSAGLDVLRPFGRFVELGKLDIYQDAAVGLGAFRRNLSFAAVDLEQVLRTRPGLVADLLRDLGRRLRAGTLRPLPADARPIADVRDAFRQMAAARHVGKLVVLPREGDAPVRPAPDQAPAVAADATYLITGGLGGLGLLVAAWLADGGARHLVLLGRRGEDGADDQTRAALAELRGRGVEVLAPAVDVADAAALGRLLERIDAELPPLRGVVHAAGLLDDGVLLQLDAGRFAAVAAPKMRGSWNLHVATQERAAQDRPLDFFVLFSSGASLLGSPGQGNYAAANAFVDALAHHRAALGLPATAIAWGPWSEVGLAARPERGGRLARAGIESLTPARGLAAFGQLLRRPPVHVGVLPIDVPRWRRANPALAELPVLAELLRDDAAGADRSRAGAELRARLLATEAGPARATVLAEHVRGQIAQVLRMQPTRLDHRTPLDTLGFDSLMALELRNRLEASLGVPISATMAWNYPTIERIVPHLAERMEIPLDEPDPPRGRATPEGRAADEDPDTDAELAAILGGLDALTDAELSAMRRGETTDAIDAAGG